MSRLGGLCPLPVAGLGGGRGERGGGRGLRVGVAAAALDEDQHEDHHGGGQREAQVLQEAALTPRAVPRLPYEAVVGRGVAFEGLAAPIADDSADRARRQGLRHADPCCGPARLVPAANQPNRLPGHGLGEPSIVFALHLH